MASFPIAYNLTSVVEGNYANDPHDSGGETWKGISRKNFPAWAGWRVIDTYKKLKDFPHNLLASAELQKDVMLFFKRTFWDINSLGFINNQSMANEIYDTGVNCGTDTAARFFQRVLKVTTKAELLVDGKVGPKTIATFNNMHPGDQYMVWVLFNALQGARYVGICEAKPSQEKFIKSWASRVFEEQ